MAWVQKRVLSSGATSYKVGWREPSGSIRSKTFRRSTDARRFAREVERSKDLGTYRDPSLGKVTLSTFFRHHMDTSSLSPKTCELYESQWRIHVAPRLGHVRLNAISRAEVKSFLAGLRDGGTGAPTVSAVHRLLRSVLSAALDEERISANPASRLRLPAPPKRAMHIFDASQVTNLADAVDDRFATLIYFLAYCGPRIGEAAALRVRHVDLMNRRVLIEEAVKELGGGGLITGPTKNGQKRAVTLPAFLADLLAQHLAQYSDPTDPDAHVFVSLWGRPLRANGFRKHVLKPALGKAGLPSQVRTHDLRHTAAAIAISAGVHPKKIQEMLGHSSITVTLDVYGYLFDSLHHEAADLLDGVYRKAADDARLGSVLSLSNSA